MALCRIGDESQGFVCVRPSCSPCPSQGFIKAKKYPSSTGVEVMCEGGESAMFKQLFQCWKDRGQPQGVGPTSNGGKIGGNQQTLARKQLSGAFQTHQQTNSCVFICFLLNAFVWLCSSLQPHLVLFLFFFLVLSSCSDVGRVFRFRKSRPGEDQFHAAPGAA